LLPENGAKNVPLRPTLSWGQSGSTGIFYYEVQLSKDPKFETDPAKATAPVYWNLVHGGESAPHNSWTVPEGFSLEPNTVYYWRVRPRIQGDGTPGAWAWASQFSTIAAALPFPLPPPRRHVQP